MFPTNQLRQAPVPALGTSTTREPEAVTSISRGRRKAAGLAAMLLCLGASQAAGQAVCKPALTLKSTTFSAPVNLHRVWRAQFDVDASTCATTSGLFSIQLVRVKENSMDVAFVEPFRWNKTATEARVDFWHDEAVLDFRVTEVAACPCRNH